MNNAPAIWDYASETAVRFVEHHLELPFGTLNPAQGLLVVQNSEPVAAVAYHNYRELSEGKTIEGSIASTSPKWATRKVLRALFDYPFQRVGVDRFQALTKMSNDEAQSFLLRVGFKSEGVMRRYWDGTEDAIVFSMLRAECKWLRKEDGQERSKAA